MQVTDAAAGAGAVQGSISGVSSGVWTFYTVYFEAISVYASICLDKNSATAGTMLFDEATLYGVTPLCIGADALAMDAWAKDTTSDLYREHNGANTKDGSFYALKIVVTAVTDFVQFPGASLSVQLDWIRRFAGRTVTFGAWIKTGVASHARLAINDGLTTTYSSYHTGGGSYEWLEVTKAVASGATAFVVYIYGDIAPTPTGTTIIYVSQPMLALASCLGQGNYQPREDVISFETQIMDRVYNATSGYTTFAAIALNLEANSEGKIPKGALTLYVYAGANDSGSAAGIANLFLRRSSGAGTQFIVSLNGLANDAIFRTVGEQMLNDAGDMDIGCTATGAGTLDIPNLAYKGLFIRNI
jgi:hypothetical protein